MRPNSGEGGLQTSEYQLAHTTVWTNLQSPCQTGSTLDQVVNTTVLTNLQPTCQTGSTLDPCISCLALTYQPKNLGLPRTLMCKIVTPTQTWLLRALIDPGSQISAIKKSTAEKLKLRGPKRTLKFGACGAQKIEFNNMTAVNFKIASLDESFVTDFNVEAITMPRVTCDIAKIDIDPQNYSHLKNVKFSEQLPMDEASITEVELLIGEPNTTYLFKDLIVGEFDEPAAALYKIGNCLTGTANPKNGENHLSMFATATYEEDPIEEIKAYFSLENLGIEDPSTANQLTAEEQRAEELMQQHTYYDEVNKCYFTRLLWADQPIEFTNIRRATAAATRVVRRFSKDGQEDMWKSIQKVYKTNLDLGISELVPSHDLKKKENFHYITQSMVFKPESSTTPIRPVFNANQEFGDNKTSFNKRLLEGANYLPQLAALLIRFRYYSNVALLDISKLYSRIRLPTEDAEFQRFFWSEEKMGPNDEQAKLKSFRHTRLIFGSRSSPYQAQWVLRLHAQRHQNFYLENCTYLDDIFIGDASPDKVQKELKNLIWVLQEGDFPPQKIVANNISILRDLDESQKGPTDVHKIYGQTWDLQNDLLSLNFKKEMPVMEKTFTKRECLSQLMQIYDILGIAQPYTLLAKIIFQTSCEIKTAWDDELPDPLQRNYQKWLADYPLLSQIKIKRCVLPPNGGKICYLASFSDASDIAIGVNIYVVSEDDDGNRYSELAFVKAKVLPLSQTRKKAWTTPRGELAAAQLSARAANYVAEALTTVVGAKPNIYFFSDSAITLYRLKKPSEMFTTWVANRLQYIQDTTRVEQWKHVKSHENPSDISSRGSSLGELLKSTLFFKGPKWLTERNPSFVDVNELSQDESTLDCKEIKQAFKGPHMNVLFSTLDEEDDVIKSILEKTGHWRKSVHIIAWIRRFLKNAQQKVESGGTRNCMGQSGTNPTSKNMSLRSKSKQKKNLNINYDELYLHSSEVVNAEHILFKYAQSQEFAEEISTLSQGETISKNSSIRKLLPIWDEEEGLLKHNSRIIGYQPIILPKDHIVTKLFIHDVHKKFGHSGPSITLYKLRKSVWVTSGRLQVKKAIYQCACRKTILLYEQMGKIPSWRTCDTQIWSRVGTDVLGPFFVKPDKIPACQKRGNEEEEEPKTIKTFAILWTDLVSRGVMVDLLYSADTEGVLRSLRKLTSIYGSAKIYYSDNASYYKKSSVELKAFMASIDWPKIRKQVSLFNGDWLFSTEAAPFRNATSERLIFSIKEALRKVIKKNILPFSELATSLLEISAYTNNRPIGFLSSDPNETMKPVSPSMLTIGREIEVLGEYTGKDPNLQELYYHRTKTIQSFIKNWTALYLQQLSPTKKWLEKNPFKIKEGMVLFIKDENKMRDLWKAGVVTKIIRSKSDNLPRTLQLRTATSKQLVRPVQKCAIPEWQITHEEDQPTSHFLNIADVAIPELSEQKDLKDYLNHKQL